MCFPHHGHNVCQQSYHKNVPTVSETTHGKNRPTLIWDWRRARPHVFVKASKQPFLFPSREQGRQAGSTKKTLFFIVLLVTCSMWNTTVVKRVAYLFAKVHAHVYQLLDPYWRYNVLGIFHYICETLFSMVSRFGTTCNLFTKKCYRCTWCLHKAAHVYAPVSQMMGGNCNRTLVREVQKICFVR